MSATRINYDKDSLVFVGQNSRHISFIKLAEYFFQTSAVHNIISFSNMWGLIKARSLYYRRTQSRQPLVLSRV